MENLWTKSTDEILKTALEYGTLAAQTNLSEQDADRLEQILTDAVEDEILDFWLTEVDRFLGHYFGLLEDKEQRLQTVEQLTLSLSLPSYQEKGPVLKNH